MVKKLLYSAAGICILLLILLGISDKAQSATGTEILGFAYSSNIGWISFSQKNCDIDQDGQYEAGGPVGCPTFGTAHPYGVSVSEGTNTLSGYAWSSNIGWISFNSSDLAGCPSGTCQARFNDPNFTGWAKALSADGNGWDGWIRLSGTAQDGASYGLRHNSNDSITGFAWGSEVIGAIESRTLTMGALVPSCQNGIDDDDDGVMDEADPDCLLTGTGVETTPNPICDNNGDDDGDGRADYEVGELGLPVDPGCESSEDDSENDYYSAPVVELKVGITNPPLFDSITLPVGINDAYYSLSITNGTTSTMCEGKTIPGFDLYIDTGGATSFNETQFYGVSESTKFVVTCSTMGLSGSDSADIIIKKENEF